jgi:predicted transcriptional regulator
LQASQLDDVSERDRDLNVLNLMLCDSSWPWSVDEIARELQTRIGAYDSVSRLAEAGLVHRLGEFVFPTRAARRADELGIGDA